MWPFRQYKSDPAGLIGSPSHASPNSLFGEILDWLLAPLLFLWPISIIVIYSAANNIANLPYDRTLADNVHMLARFVSFQGDHPAIHFPVPVRSLFKTTQADTVYYQISQQQRTIAGDKEIPWHEPTSSQKISEVSFRDDVILNEGVRVAYLYLAPPASAEKDLLLIQVAETKNQRSELASKIVTGTLLPQLATVPLTVILVWIGLTRGINPLNRLIRLIRRRRPTDFSPIAPASVPEEVRPLIVAFNDMMDRLEENMHTQRRFIADAAHQMRTPLTGLKMQTDLALMENDPEQLRYCLTHIAESAERASHLINQLLSLARAESSSEKLYTVGQVDLGKILSNVIQDIFPRASSKNIDLGIEIPLQPVIVDGNEILLGEMIKNLVDNAIKYTPENGCVTARVYDQPLSTFEVEDSGIGIPENESQRIFERFYRALGSGVDGSGLGLAIAREIADLHRAVILLQPNPEGRGTLAKVTFTAACCTSLHASLS